MICLLGPEIRADLQRKLASPMEFIAENAAALVFLCVALAGAGRASTAMAEGSDFAGRFLLAFFCMGAVQTVPRMVTDEPGSAVLEQLCMSKIPLWRIALARDVAGAIMFVPVASLLAAVASAITGVSLRLPSAGAVAPIVMMRLGMLGPGFALAAVALLNRRSGPLIALASTGMLALVLAVPASAIAGPIALAFPYTAWQPHVLGPAGANLIGAVSPVLHVVAACISSLVYLAAGILTFNWAFRRAVATGTLAKW